MKAPAGPRAGEPPRREARRLPVPWVGRQLAPGLGVRPEPGVAGPEEAIPASPPASAAHAADAAETRPAVVARPGPWAFGLETSSAREPTAFANSWGSSRILRNTLGYRHSTPPSARISGTKPPAATLPSIDFSIPSAFSFPSCHRSRRRQPASLVAAAVKWAVFAGYPAYAAGTIVATRRKAPFPFHKPHEMPRTILGALSAPARRNAEPKLIYLKHANCQVDTVP